jgi:hypothetical protein
MLEEAGLDEAEVMKITPELQAAIKKYRETPTHNPKQHAKVMPAVKTPKTSESYTLEEWMGMMEEAGYDVSEYSLWRPKESGAKSTGVMKDPKKPKTPPAERDARNDPSSEFSKGLAAWLRAKQNKKLNELSPETFTLEEWMGMLEEAGYSLDERNMANKAAKNAAVAKIGQQAAASGVFTNTNPRNPNDQAQIARNNLSMGRMAADKVMATKAFNSTTKQNLDKSNRSAKDGEQVAIDRASPAFGRTADRVGGGRFTDFERSNQHRRETHRQQQQSGRRQDQNPGAQQMTPGQKYMGTVPTGRATSGMNASRDGTLGSKTDRATNDKYGYGNGNKELAARGQATKARLGLDRELRGASVPGTVDFARDKDKLKGLQSQQKRAMAAESINENTVSRLQQLAGINPTQ